MKKLKEIFGIIFGKNEEDGKMKQKWSLKKKLLLGGGILGGLIVSIFAYGKSIEEEYEEDDYLEDEDFDGVETDETDFDMTEGTEVEVEIQE